MKKAICTSEDQEKLQEVADRLNASQANLRLTVERVPDGFVLISENLACKTLTMDYEAYQDELSAAKFHGREEFSKAINDCFSSETLTDHVIMNPEDLNSNELLLVKKIKDYHQLIKRAHN